MKKAWSLVVPVFALMLVLGVMSTACKKNESSPAAPAVPTDTPVPAATSTPTATPTPTSTSCGTVSYQPTYTFDSNIECFFTDNALGSSYVFWESAPPAGASGGALGFHVKYDPTNQSGDEAKVAFNAAQNLSGKRMTVRVWVDPACKGSTWGGAVNPFVQDASTGWHDQWQNIVTFGAWHNYTLDIYSTAVTQLGVKMNMGAGAGDTAEGNTYIDSIVITDIPTPTPTVGCGVTLLNGCETIGENGTWSGAQASRAIVTSPAAAITQGTSALAVTLNVTGWTQDAMVLTGFNTGISNGVTTNTWMGIDQIKMNVYVPAGTFGSWAQMSFVAVSNTDDGNLNGAGADWDEALDGTSEKALTINNTTGAMTEVTWDLQWAASPIDPNHTINKLVFIVNGNAVVGQPIYIDNIRLLDCP